MYTKINQELIKKSTKFLGHDRHRWDKAYPKVVDVIFVPETLSGYDKLVISYKLQN